MENPITDVNYVQESNDTQKGPVKRKSASNTGASKGGDGIQYHWFEVEDRTPPTMQQMMDMMQILQHDNHSFNETLVSEIYSVCIVCIVLMVP